MAQRLNARLLMEDRLQLLHRGFQQFVPVLSSTTNTFPEKQPGDSRVSTTSIVGERAI